MGLGPGARDDASNPFIPHPVVALQRGEDCGAVGPVIVAFCSRGFRALVHRAKELRRGLLGRGPGRAELALHCRFAVVDQHRAALSRDNVVWLHISVDPTNRVKAFTCRCYIAERAADRSPRAC